MIDAAGVAGTSPAEGSERFVLEVGPVGENARTARLFGASIARHFECDEEQVEDLKLALSEAVNRAFRAFRSATGEAEASVSVEVVKAEHDLTFSVYGPAGNADPAPEDRWAPSEEELILALYPEAQFDASEGLARFTVTLI